MWILSKVREGFLNTSYFTVAWCFLHQWSFFSSWFERDGRGDERSESVLTRICRRTGPCRTEVSSPVACPGAFGWSQSLLRTCTTGCLHTSAFSLKTVVNTLLDAHTLWPRFTSDCYYSGADRRVGDANARGCITWSSTVWIILICDTKIRRKCSWGRIFQAEADVTGKAAP